MMEERDLQWIDRFVNEIKPYVFVREEDSLLILVPNQAHRLNKTGLGILKSVISGKKISEILKTIPDEKEARERIHQFFCDIRALVKGCAIEDADRRGVEEIEFHPPINSLPVLSEIAVTYRCNLDCAFCYAHGCLSEHPERDAGDVFRMIDVIYRDAKVPSVSFTGGEPTLRDDLESLIERAASIGMWTNLITNGVLVTKERADRLKKSGLRSAQVSLEGARPEIHDRIVGASGAFHKTVAGIGNLQDAGVRVHTNTTLNGWNAEDVQGEFARFVHSLGMTRFSMNLMIPCGRAIENLTDLRMRYCEVAPILLSVRESARRVGVKFLWYSPTPYCMFNPIAEGLGNKSCAACDGLLSVAPDGDVLPCSSYNESVGNLLASSFREIWSNKRARRFKDKEFIPELCRDCELENVCCGACPLYWKAEGFGELESKRISPAKDNIF